MSARQDPTRREDLLFMLLHGGAASPAIAERVVDNAIAEALAEQEAELARLRTRVDEVERLYTFDTAALKKRVGELETLLSDRSEPDVDGAGRTYEEYLPSVPQQRGEAS